MIIITIIIREAFIMNIIREAFITITITSRMMTMSRLLVKPCETERRLDQSKQGHQSRIFGQSTISQRTPDPSWLSSASLSSSSPSSSLPSSSSRHRHHHTILKHLHPYHHGHGCHHRGHHHYQWWSIIISKYAYCKTGRQTGHHDHCHRHRCRHHHRHRHHHHDEGKEARWLAVSGCALPPVTLGEIWRLRSLCSELRPAAQTPRQTWSASLCIILNTVRISRETAAKTPQTWSAQLLYFCITAWITLCIVNQTHIWTHKFSYWKIEILKSSRRLADFWMLTNLAKLLGLMLDCCCQIDTCLIFFRHLQNTLLAFCILNDTCLIILTDAVTIPNAYILYNYESCKKGHWADSVPLFGMYHSNLSQFYQL